MRMEYLVFKRSGLLIGIDIEYIRQVVGDVAVAPVPLTPRRLRGTDLLQGGAF